MQKNKSGSYYRLKLKNREIFFTARPGTTDGNIIRINFFRGSELYVAPSAIDPEVIFDVGAHIGVVSVYYSVMYPRAKIYAFEPFPGNFNLLKINAASNSDKIIPIQKGIGNKEGRFTYYFSDNPSNFGGGTFKNIGCDRRKKFRFPVTTIKKFIREEKIKKIDILKVDTEGMEFDIITNIPTDILKKIKLIVGECHGIKDLELFLYLSKFFNLGFNKEYDRRCFNFIAVNKQILKRKNDNR